MPGNNGDFQLTHTNISITGINTPVHFTNLNIRQNLADVCSGSFSWRQEGNVTLQDQISFYERVMAKQVDISIQDEFQFSGIITSVYLHNEDEEASEYLIHFEGLFMKFNQYRECNSWIKKTFGQIIKELNQSNNPPIVALTQDSDALFYTVQYNQTHFEFLRMMATRLGKWMYYDGKELSFETPSGQAVELTKDRDIQNLSIFSNINYTHEQITGFDTYTGAAIQNRQQAAAASGLIAAASQGGQQAYGSNQTGMHVPYAANETVLRTINGLQHQSVQAGSVTLQANTHNSALNIGKKIKVMELNGSSGGDFIITQITHSCPGADSYANFIHFIPADAAVPPYTNALVYPACEAQPALVVDNVDEDGHDRIKVRFPWQRSTESTPWLSIVTPYAGKDKGMRFIPEKNEEVMVDFISHNAERPYVIGTMFTGGNKSGHDVNNNCIKSLGSRSGRRFEINDCAGTLKVYDNYNSSTPKNGLLMKRKDDDIKILLESQKGEEDYSVIALNNETFLNLGLVNGGALVAEIRLEKDGKKITIKSDGAIDLSSGSISMNADTISIKANKELKMEGTQQGTSVKGQKINFDGTTDVSIKGVNVTVEASANLELKGGPMASLTAALVKIN